MSVESQVARLERRPGALEGAVHRRDGRVEKLRDLGGLPAQHLAEDQDGALTRREVLERGDEREPHGLARLGHCRRIAVRHDERVGRRLDPRHLREGVQVRLDGLAGRPEVHRARPALPAGEHVEADVRGDAVEPGAQRGATFEPVVAAPGPDEGVLHGVLRLERRAEHPVAVAGQLGPVLLELLLQLGGRGRGAQAGHRRDPHTGAVTVRLARAGG